MIKHAIYDNPKSLRVTPARAEQRSTKCQSCHCVNYQI